MKLTLNTELFKKIMLKAMRGATNNKQIPLSSMVCISAYNNKVELVTTDGTNYLYVREQIAEEDEAVPNFYVVANIDKLSKIVAKTTSENITLEVTDNGLTLVGNGSYNLELPIDENGDLVKFPNPIETLPNNIIQVGEMSLETIKSIITSIIPSVAVGNNAPNVYKGVYFGDIVIATDRFKISALREKVIATPSLISQWVVNLWDIMDGAVKVSAFDNKLIFETDKMTLYSVSMAEIDDYPATKIIEVVTNESEKSMVKIPKKDLVDLLERINLFVGELDNGAVNLEFTKEGLNVSSIASTGVESVEYIEGKDIKEFSCSVNVDVMLTQIKAQLSDVVELWYGEPNRIKLVDDNITLIVALME